MPYHLLLDQAGEAKLGKLADRHDQARHRALLRRQGGAPRHPRAGPARREDPQEEDRRGARAQALHAAPVRQGPGARPAVDDRGVPDLRPPARAAHRRHRARSRWRRARRRRHRALRGRPGRAARHRPRHVSVRHLARTRSPARPASAPASGRKDIDEVWGVTKAYATRVGAGPFPTELDDEVGEEIRQRGGEFGTTTGRAAAHRLARPRRAALRRAHQRADRPGHHQARRAHRLRHDQGLHALPRRRRGVVRRRSPTTSRCCTTPRASTWSCPAGARTSAACRTGSDLPQAARDYLDFIAEQFLGVPIALVGVGPGREQIIWTEAGDRLDAAAA